MSALDEAGEGSTCSGGCGRTLSPVSKVNRYKHQLLARQKGEQH